MDSIQFIHDVAYDCGIGLLIVAVLVLAWKSTYVRNSRPVTLIIVERDVFRTAMRMTEGMSENVQVLDDEDAGNIEFTISEVDDDDSLSEQNDEDVVHEESPEATVEGSSVQPGTHSNDLVTSNTEESLSSSAAAEVPSTSSAPDCLDGPSEDGTSETSPDVGVSAVPESTPISSIEETAEQLATSSPGTSNETGESSEDAADCIKITLKFLDERLLHVRASKKQNVGEFARAHFAQEISENRKVKFIYKGRLLKHDQTVEQNGLHEDCVVHCHVSQPSAPQPPAPPPAAPQQQPAWRPLQWWRALWRTLDPADDDDGLDISSTFGICLCASLLIVWVARFMFANMFSGFSTSMLVGLTLVVLMPAYGAYPGALLSFTLDRETMRSLGVERVLVLDSAEHLASAVRGVAAGTGSGGGSGVGGRSDGGSGSGSSNAGRRRSVTLSSPSNSVREDNVTSGSAATNRTSESNRSAGTFLASDVGGSNQSSTQSNGVNATLGQGLSAAGESTPIAPSVNTVNTPLLMDFD